MSLSINYVGTKVILNLARVILYLYPNCLRKRQIEKINVAIYFGIISIAFGIFTALVSLPLGAILALGGVGAIAYGIMKRGEKPEEMIIDELQIENCSRTASKIF